MHGEIGESHRRADARPAVGKPRDAGGIGQIAEIDQGRGMIDPLFDEREKIGTAPEGAGPGKGKRGTGSSIGTRTGIVRVVEHGWKLALGGRGRHW